MHAPTHTNAYYANVNASAVAMDDLITSSWTSWTTCAKASRHRSARRWLTVGSSEAQSGPSRPWANASRKSVTAGLQGALRNSGAQGFAQLSRPGDLA